MGYRLGIDMGTTFTAAAALEIGDTQGSADVPTMVGLGNRALQIPSVLYLQDDGGFLVGEAAERRGQTDPSRLVREFKRRLGDPVPLIVGGTPYPAEVLSAQLLSWVVAAAIERRGAEPDEIVLTHPANWGPYRREYFDQIIALADIGPASTCPEPQAAAIQYAAEARLDEGSRVLVYDLGGGTFDVCVLEKTAAGFEILGTPDGIEHLGGIDFDEAVFDHVLHSLGAVDLEGPEAQTALTRLRRDCVEAKEALSVDVDTLIPVTLPGRSTSVRLTRAELEGLIEPALTDTMETTARALRAAGTSPERLTAIVLVGGSSRIPLVSHLLQNRFETPTALDTHPKHVIALGAVLFTPPGPRRSPADKATDLLPAFEEPPTLAQGSNAPARTWADVTVSPSYGAKPPPRPGGLAEPQARRRWLSLVVAVAAVAGIGVAAVVFANRDGDAADSPPSSAPTSATANANAGLYGVGVSPDNRRVYVSHLNANAVTVIDGSTGLLIGTAPVGSKPLGLAVDDTSGDLYVANYAAGTVTRINGSTLQPDAVPIKVGKQPQSIIVLPGTETAYVTNVGDDTVSVLDLSTSKVVKTIRVGDRPLNITTDSKGRRVYVTNVDSRSVSVIDTETQSVRTLQVDAVPHDIAVSPDSDLLYLTSEKSSQITVLDVDGGSSPAPITLGAPLTDLAISPDGKRLYATSALQVAVVDTGTGASAAGEIPVEGPAGIAVSPDGNRLYVTANGTSTLTTIDTATNQPVGPPATISAPTPSGSPT
jgi:YVTN family beta-propeller protein